MGRSIRFRGSVCADEQVAGIGRRLLLGHRAYFDADSSWIVDREEIDFAKVEDTQKALPLLRRTKWLSCFERGLMTFLECKGK